MLFHLTRCFSRPCPAVFALLLGLFPISLSAAAGAEAGSLIGAPVLGKNADGQLEVFKIEQDGQLHHRWQKPSNGDWSAWSSLGGSVWPGIAVATNADGQMEVFAVNRTNDSLMRIRQQSPNSHNWSEWKNLGGELQPPVAANRNSDGRLEVFAVAAGGGNVRHLWQTNVHGGWSAWASLGGNLEPGPVVAANGDGRLEVFGVEAGSKNLTHCWQRSLGTTNGWSGWDNLGGSISSGFVVARTVVARLEVFAVSITNGAVVRICQKSTEVGAPWSPWLDFGGDVGADPNLAVAHSADGRLEVYAIAARDGTVLHRWEMQSGGSDLWSAWSSLDAAAQPHPAANNNEDGNLEIFTVDKQNRKTINYRRQISYSSGWLDWANLDHTTFEYASRTWQLDEGLPDNLVQAIAQTRDGYLWLGTPHGLARFDGVSFTSFDTRNTPELKDSSITALCADADGALWIGTDGGGLTRLKNGVWSHYCRSDGLAGDNLKVITKTSDGALWIGTTTGMSRFKKGKFTNYTTKQGLFSDMVSYIYEDHDATLWVATGKGLNRLKADEIMDSFNMPKGLPNDAVRGICQDKGGRIWIGSNNGMLWYNWYWTGSFYAYNTRYGLSDSFVTTICEDRVGNLWVGTYSGLNRFREGRFFNELNNEGVPYDKVNALFEDREGNLWVGSNEGLSRLTPRRFTAYTKQQGLSHNHIMSVLEDRGGGLWLGTWGGGADLLKDERIMDYAATNGLAQDLILSLCEGRDGSIWMGADYDGGLTRLKDGTFTHYTWKNGMINAPVRVIHEDESGKIWIGTSRGLSCLRDGTFTNYTTRENLAGDSVRAICEDHAGSLWFGTGGGLSRLKDGQFTNFTTRNGLSDNAIIALYEDDQHDLWIGTGNGGLNRYKDGRFTAYTTQQGMFSDEIFEILEDDQGWLWMSCSRGIFRVLKRGLAAFDRGDIKTLSCIAYVKVDGMESPQCNGLGKPAGWKARDGRLWFPTSKGAVVVDPAANMTIGVPAPVYVEKLIADKKSWQRVTPTRFISETRGTPSPPPDSPIRIPPGRGELEFQYTMLNFQAPEKCLFKYRLEGLDPDWIDAGSRRTAHYNNMPPGSYRFRVIACTSDGVWNDTGASLAIVLQPHLWQTWWFQGLASLLIVGSATGVALRLGKRNMLRQLAQLEQEQAVEKERARIAKDMHDQLGAGLTQVGLLGELAKRNALKPEQTQVLAGKICEIAREQAQTLDEIVWTVDPKNDTLTKLAAYMAVYVEEFFNATDIRCRLDIPPGLPPSPVSADLRHNLFLTVKEALNNIIKHARASEVLIRFATNQDRLEVFIEDNGRGFVFETRDQFGNGLCNMEHRVREMDGEFALSTQPGKGTKIHFQVPLKKTFQKT
ncbi:MAG: Two component regulator, sensor protein [Pedosphaera sp.]|nr:Two component regulator, sensor protein [Pedosphaera sp.]